MTEIAKELGDIMKQGVHEHAFCSALQFSLWRVSLALEQKEARDSTK